MHFVRLWDCMSAKENMEGYVFCFLIQIIFGDGDSRGEGKWGGKKVSTVGSMPHTIPFMCKYVSIHDNANK